MAHIILRPKAGQPGANELFINGVDFGNAVFRGVELVEVGDDPRFSEVGFRVTFVVSRLDLGGDEDLRVTDRLPEMAQRVRSLVDPDEAGEE